MATVASVVTIDTNEWLYVDSFGIEHAVTNAQTFTLTIDDNSTTDVHYYVATAQSVSTTDGYKVVIRPHTVGADSGNLKRTVSPLTDAGQGSDFYNLRGEFRIECPVSKRLQIWRVAKMNPSDADFGSAGTITMTLEDQWGNRMVMPHPIVGTAITVAQAA